MARRARPQAAPEEPPFAPSVRVDGNRHVALEFARARGESSYLTFAPRGLVIERLGTERFLRRFDRTMDRDPAAAALQLLSDLPSAYLPGDGVHGVLLEIIMSKTDTSTATVAELTALYNDVAKAIGRGPVKMFKSRAEASKRLAAASAEAAKLTPDQQQHRAAADAEAAKKAAASAESKASKTSAAARLERAAARVVGEKTEKQVAARKAASEKAKRFPKAAKPAAEKKPRGPGIGTFCEELIKKGRTNDDVLSAVKRQFPDAKTSSASVAWYRNKLKSEGAIA